MAGRVPATRGGTLPLQVAGKTAAMTMRERELAMTLSIRATDPVSRPFFAGEVSGIDITRPLSHAEAAALSAGMDQYGVLVFHDQRFTDETQLAFSRNFGGLEQATGDIA